MNSVSLVEKSSKPSSSDHVGTGSVSLPYCTPNAWRIPPPEGLTWHDWHFAPVRLANRGSPKAGKLMSAPSTTNTAIRRWDIINHFLSHVWESTTRCGNIEIESLGCNKNILSLSRTLLHRRRQVI